MFRLGVSIAVFLFCLDACFAGTQPLKLSSQNSSGIPQITAQPQKEKLPKQEMRPGQIVVKLKPGVALADLRSLHRRHGLLSSYGAFKDRPAPSEALARMRAQLRQLQPEHQDWYWQLDRDSKEYKDYLGRLHQQRAALQERVRKQEEFLARLEARKKRAPQGLGAVPDLSNIHLLRFSATADIASLVKAYAADERVEYAEPNYIVRANRVPNDTYFSTAGSWQQAYDDLWGLKRIEAGVAWEVTKGKGIIVAVVDSGVDYVHEDIAANIWHNPLEVPANGVDDDGNGYIDDDKGWDFIAGVDAKGEKFTEDNDPQDELGHGTHVAGTIAALGNDKGIIGVAPEALIMPVKGLNADGWGDDLTLGNSLKYATDLGADVINNSWGGNAVSRLIEDITAYALAHGAVMVAAAGNDNADAGATMPAYIPGVITVAAVDHNDQKSFFSNWGYRVDVAAPGGSRDWEISETVQASAGAYGFCNGALQPRLTFQIYTAFTPAEKRQGFGQILMTKSPAGGIVLYDIYTPDEKTNSLIKREGGLVLGDTYSPVVEYQAPYQFALKYENPVFVFYLQEETSAKSLTLDAVQYAGGTWEEIFFGQGLTNGQRTGVDILSLAAAKARGGGLPMPDAKYSRMMGTSMACPHVAGTAALVLAAHPEFSVEDVRQAILSGSDDIGVPGFDMYYGYGRLNAAKAVSMGSVCASKIGQPQFFDYLKGRVEIYGTAAGPDFQRYSLRYRPWSFYPQELALAQWQVILSVDNPVDGGLLGVWDTTRITDGAMYQLELVVEDTFGNSFRADSVVFVDQRLKDGWPYTGAFFMAPPVTADIDHDGYQEVLAKQYDARSGRILVSIFRHDGSKLNGWPEDIRQWGATDLLYSPLACDLDNDGDLEIILSFYRQEDRRLYLYALHHDGSIVQGWPALIPLNIGDGQAELVLLLAAADVNNDGYAEVAVAVDDQLKDTGHICLFGHNGGLLSGWPVVQPLPQHSGGVALNGNGCLALGDVSGDDAAEIVIGLRNRAYVYAVNGSLLNGAAITIGDWINDFHRNINVRNLILADLDQDGKAEIVLQMGWWKKIYAFRADGAAVTGFPVEGPLSWDMALADINNDGYPEIIADSAISDDKPVYAWRHDGSPLAGWPPELPQDYEGNSGISVADLDHNGIKEVILHSWHGRVTAIEPDGRQLLLNLPEYVPTPAYAFSAGTPANPAVIADLDNDGKTEIITKIDSVNEYLYQGRLYAWELDTDYGPADWPMYGHDAQATRNASGPARPAPQTDLSANGQITAYDAALALQQGKAALEAALIAYQAAE
ncbi:MAG: S8 family serine peptidase [Candidatus Omnitrophota bacterium]|nr:S8 family serine peptidase [Candidatus Omnitrophota bacterium]